MNETIMSSTTVVTPILTGGAVLVVSAAIIALAFIFNTENGQFRRNSMLSEELSGPITRVFKIRRYVLVVTIVVLTTVITGTFLLLMMA